MVQARTLEQAQRFHACKFQKSNQGKVLDRYFNAFASFQAANLRRHACHVSAWVALLEEKVILRPQGLQGMSPVRLLLHMLRHLRRKHRHGIKLKRFLVPVLARARQLSREGQIVCSEHFEEIDQLEQMLSCVESPQLPPMRRFQRHILTWRNLSVEAREGLTTKLSLRLAQILRVKQVHPGRLLQLIFQSAAALSPPRVEVGSERKATSSNEASAETGAGWVQGHLRKLLFKSWRAWCTLGLDWKKVEPAVLRIKIFLEKFEERFGDISLASSSGAWSRLKNLLYDDAPDATYVPPAATQSHGRNPRKRVQHIRRAKLKDRSMIKDYYCPGKRIRSFPTVVEKESDPKTLKCDVCGYLITTNWYFQHPKTGEMAVLVPNNGHALCRRMHKNCKFLVVDGSPYKFDCPNNIDYCSHQVLRHVCAPCGGSNICSHGKPRWNCALCKHMIRKRAREPSSAAGDMSQESNAKED